MLSQPKKRQYQNLGTLATSVAGNISSGDQYCDNKTHVRQSDNINAHNFVVNHIKQYL